MPIKIKDADGNEHEVMTAQEQTDMVTGAISKSSKKLSEELTAGITKAVGTSLAETLTTFESKIAGQIEEKTKATTPPKPGDQQDIAKHPEFVGMKKQLDDALQTIKAGQEVTKQERMKARDLKLRDTLKTKLAGQKLDADALEDAVLLLVDGKKLVRYASDDSEDVVFTLKEGDVDLETGLKSWVQTDSAKRYMPPRGASGSGERTGGKPPPVGTSGGKIAPGALGKALLGAVDSAQGLPLVTE